ncbi:MAG: ATPase domain-containing protein [Gallionella sp.]
MPESLDKVLGLLEKKFGKGTVGYASKYTGLDVKRMPTGSFSMDLETGGGYPLGRIVEIYGDLSSGKTTLALKAIVETQERGKNAVYIDAEGCFDPVWAKTLGVNLETLRLSKTDKAEVMLSVANACVRSGDCGILVIDSVAALAPQMDEDKGFDEPETLGDRAIMMNRFIRRTQSALNLKEDGTIPNECLVILINQTREAIGARGDPTRTTGGRGIGFGASIRILVRRKDWIKEGTGDNEEVVGQTIHFRTTKSKVYMPYREGDIDFYIKDAYGVKKGEIDRLKEVVNYGVYYNIIKQAGAFFSYDSHKFQGREKLVAFFKDNIKEAVKVKSEIMAVALRTT